MKTQNPQTGPCDGTIPEGWEMPELDGRIKTIETGIAIEFRGLKAPAPLVGTLKALERLPAGHCLIGHYPHSPIHLFPVLMEEGWQWEILQEDEEGAQLRIFKEDTGT